MANSFRIVSISLYHKYIAWHLARNISSVIVLLTSLVWITQINRILIVIATKSTKLYSEILHISLHLIPYILFNIFPIAVLIGVLYTLHRYRRTNAILAFQNCGISDKKIFSTFHFIAITVVFIHYVVGFKLMPVSYHHFKTTQLKFKEDNLVDMIEEGRIIDTIKGLTVYVDKKVDAHRFAGIFIYDSREKNSMKAFTAQEASIYPHEDAVLLELRNGFYKHENTSEKTIHILEFEAYSLKIKLSNNTEAVDRLRDPNEMNMYDLMKFNDKSDIKYYNKVKTNMHQRIVWPIFSIFIALLCLKIEWLFYYRNYSRHYNSKALFITITIALIWICINFFLKNISVNILTIGTILIYLNVIFLLPIIILMLRLSIVK